MAEKMKNQLKESGSQTAGPYVNIGMAPNFVDISGVFDEDLGCRMTNDDTKGERIVITGAIYDGDGAPVADGLVEIWQADAEGLFNSPAENRGTADPNFTGWGRCPCSMEGGVYRFETVKPGRIPAANGSLQAPHAILWIVARGINVGLCTRVYFSDEPDANAEDPVLNLVGPDRAPTLIGQRDGDIVTLDIRLQGDGETVFFDI
jgi:protocatechuate 3,4-dioxygenase alpha subunit